MIEATPSARITDLPIDERPREKMLARGASALTDAELLAIFFASGTVGMSAIELGRVFMARYGSFHALSRLTIDEITQQRGIGVAKALHLAAAFELGKRLARQLPQDVVYEQPAELVGLIASEMRAEPVEVVKVILLNARCHVLGVEEISRGGLDSAAAVPRDILHPVLLRRAHGFALVHNHPSGDPAPSAADRGLTRRMAEASQTMGVRFHDHLIIGLPSEKHPGYFSFRENGMLGS
jgi:DNA repair protein RadC